MLDSRVLWLSSPGKIEFRDEKLCHPGQDEVLCRTITSAISPGTEVAAYRGLAPLHPNVVYPRLQGYCNVSEIVDKGKCVQGYKVGDRILSFMSHRTQFLLNKDKILYKLPNEANSELIATTYLFHLGYNAVLRSNIRPASRVLVIGMGVLGLASVAMASIAGGQVFALTDQKKSRTIAYKYGAKRIFSRAELKSLSSKKIGHIDVVITTSNRWDDWNLALQFVGQLGLIAVLGFPGRGEEIPTENPLTPKFFYMKQLRIESVGLSPENNDNRGFYRFNERSNISYLADLIINKKLDPGPLISGTYSFQDANLAYESLVSRKNSPLTYLLNY